MAAFSSPPPTTQEEEESPPPPSPPPLDLPTYQDILHASRTLDSIAHRTPLQTSRLLNDELGVSVVFKCENLQRMGAFKFRGAFNAVSHYLNKDNYNGDDNNNNHTNKQRLAGILTYSSGNHAQAIALACSTAPPLPSTIIMPRDAPPAKIAATQSYGGTIIYYDRYTEQRDEVAKKVMGELPEGTVFIPPYDHRYVIAGQGTVGLEIVQDLPTAKMNNTNNTNNTLDYLFVCVGGGGLIAGISLALHTLSPHTKIIGVEPHAGNDAQQSLAAGKIIHIATPRTIADGAQTQHLGQLTFELMKRYVTKIITVSDEELVEEMKFFGTTMKMIVEPTGCLGLAGLRRMVESGEVAKGSCCGVVISGGNVDLGRYCELISGR